MLLGGVLGDLNDKNVWWLLRVQKQIASISGNCCKKPSKNNQKTKRMSKKKAAQMSGL